MAGRPWVAAADGLVLTVRLTPKGGRDSVDGIEDTGDGRAVLKVRVRAAPSDGDANDALVRLIAKRSGRGAACRQLNQRTHRAREAAENRRIGYCARRSAGENL
jgi:hypothetical protein